MSVLRVVGNVFVGFVALVIIVALSLSGALDLDLEPYQS